MALKRNWVKLALFVLAILSFVAYIEPNRSSSENRAMVSMYEPDEGAIYDVVDRMTLEKGSLAERAQRFFLYNFYHYGFPFFGSAGIVALPIRLSGQFENTPKLMLWMRQIVSVLPGIAGILVLVWLQDRFRTWRSILLFVFLSIVPGAVRNSLWLHPDNLAFFLTTIVILLLWKDAAKLGRYFYWAAFVCGILIATKLIGVYFFLTIATLLIQAIIRKKIRFREAIKKGLLFIAVMLTGLLAANPFMFHSYAFQKYIYTFLHEIGEISLGYGLVYEKGFRAAIGPAQENYGHWLLLLITVLVLVYGSFRSKDKHLYTILLTWFIPLSFVLIFISHFKYQYWYPAIMTAFSALYLIFPGNHLVEEGKKTIKIAFLIPFVLLFVQAWCFIKADIAIINAQIHQSENDPRIAFYEQAISRLKPVDKPALHLYYDYRLYLPDAQQRNAETSFEMLNYDYIESSGFEVLFLLNQRIWDYTNDNAKPIDQKAYALARVFYSDAREGKIKGYGLLYEDYTGKLFVSNKLCNSPELKGQCH